MSKDRSCIRCRVMKSRYDFAMNGRQSTGMRKVCKECEATDYEVAECNEGDEVIYTSPLKHQHTQIMQFVRMDDTGKYCYVKCDQGETKVYIPYLRIKK